VFRRVDSPLWQFRYRIRNGAWHRQSTKKASLELAVEVACEAYDLARFHQKLGLAHTTHSFAQIAAAALEELRRLIDAARGKTAYDSYVSCIERYFLPYFGDRQFEQLTHQDIQDFELWRDRQMAKQSRTSVDSPATREIPNSRHRAEIDSPSINLDTNFSFSSIFVLSVQGIVVPSYAKTVKVCVGSYTTCRNIRQLQGM